jgi:hypothetical protein
VSQWLICNGRGTTLRKEVTNTFLMEDQINNLIPTIMSEMESDGENESDELLAYYLSCNTQEKAVVDNVLMYLCGWTFKSLLGKCGIEINESGEPVVARNTEDA